MAAEPSEQDDRYMLNGTSDRPPGDSFIHDMELREEWQDEEFPRPLPEDTGRPESEDEISATDARPAPPSSLALSGTVVGGAKKRLAAAHLNLSLSNSRGSGEEFYGHASLSPTPEETPSLDVYLEALETPSDSESCTFPDNMTDLEWEDDLPRVGRGGGASGGSSQTGAEPSEGGGAEQDEVDAEGRRWRRFTVAGQQDHVDMGVLEPYLQVLSHGGYYGDGMNAIILVSACYLPENTVANYDYVMENLFRYIVGTLDLMVSENYILVYLCSMAPRNKLPTIRWLHQCYTSIDRRLKKDLKGLLVVHPAWYIKAMLTLVKPFISEKFSRKICFIRSLEELAEYIPTESLLIPTHIREMDKKLKR
ncbi:bcl-2/adenovirus E1B 19 kDa-interacting protein 2-like protein [Gadus morhua]|uniref:bcl-2/adenovirus E1B 19 kDa-interacting protein 2-like protein n=1 Tax=Gadus morhua TaxID=8049 RepID=UPI0011B449DE|nr:bcl-2/adenovirus E1B 19 kDa-interacting protein 2-like protein [Gadus morhua]